MSETRSAPRSAGQRLRDLLAGPALVDVVECYSALTGRVVEESNVEQHGYAAELVGDAAWTELGRTWARREEPAGVSR